MLKAVFLPYAIRTPCKKIYYYFFLNKSFFLVYLITSFFYCATVNKALVFIQIKLNYFLELIIKVNLLLTIKLERKV